MFFYTSNPSASHKSTNTSIICGNGTFCGNRGGNDDCCCCLGVCGALFGGGSSSNSLVCAVDTEDGDVGLVFVFVLIPSPEDDGVTATSAVAAAVVGRLLVATTTVPPLHLGSNNTSITSSTSIGTAVLGKEISPADVLVVLVSVALLLFVPHHTFLASCQRWNPFF